MCDECNPFERLLAKADAGYWRLRSIRWDQWLRHVDEVSPALAQAMRHTGIGIASGLFTGLIYLDCNLRVINLSMTWQSRCSANLLCITRIFQRPCSILSYFWWHARCC